MAQTKKISIQPLGDRILVKPAAKEGRKLPSGIIIPEAANKERPSKGQVIAVGPGKYEDGKVKPIGVKVGDTVLFSAYGYDEVKIEGEEYYIISESNLLAITK